MNPVDKIAGRHSLAAVVKNLQDAGRKVVFTNGCFDLLHIGHVRYLTAARSFGDCLVVGLNSDRSVAAIKEKGRPIITEDQRAEILASLACVDWVTLFDEQDPLALIQALRPDVLVKGADWAVENIVGARWVTAGGGTVKRVALVPEISTSQIIERIIARFGREASS